MKFGDIPGQGIADHRALSAEECASRCWNNPYCCAFEHSQKEEMCKLTDKCAPSDNENSTPYFDYVLHQKSKHISRLSSASTE